MLRFHFFTAKQGTWVHKDDRGPLRRPSTRNIHEISGHIIDFEAYDFLIWKI